MRALIGLALGFLLSTEAIAQSFFTPGPPPAQNLGPAWQLIPGGMSNDGCITVPLNVFGGCKGNGTANYRQLYVNGQTIVALGGLPICNPNTTVAPVPTGQPFQCQGLILVAQ